MKSMTRRVSLTEGSARAANSYKAKVASLTFEKADLRARIKDLIEELMKHMSDLKHASMERARAEDKKRRLRRT